MRGHFLWGALACILLTHLYKRNVKSQHTLFVEQLNDQCCKNPKDSKVVELYLAKLSFAL